MLLILSMTAAIFAAAFEKIMNRRCLKGGNSSLKYMLGYNAGAVIVICLLIPFQPFTPSTTICGLLLLSALLWFLGCWLSFKADELSEAGTTAIISQLQLVLVLCGGFYFFKESLTSMKVLGAFLIIVGLGTSIRSKSIGFGMVYKGGSAFLLSGAILLDKYLSRQVPASIITLCGFVLPLLFSVGISKKQLLEIISYSREFKFANWGIGALGALAYFALVKAMSLAPISLIAPMYQLNLVLVLLLGYLFLNERSEGFRRLVCALCILSGVVVIQC